MTSTTWIILCDLNNRASNVKLNSKEQILGQLLDVAEWLLILTPDICGSNPFIGNFKKTKKQPTSG